MKKKKTIRNGKIAFSVLFLLICFYIFRLVSIGMFDEVDGINLKEFAAARDTARETLVARRGTIYDRNGEVLAQDVNSYTVIAYLSDTRTTDPNFPKHVVDIERTAKELSPLINMKVDTIKNLLSTKNVYQVELGPGGRGITELVKEQIEALDLPGIDFIATSKRYYPYGDFLSYTLGYAKTDENTGTINGEFGIEAYYDDILKGEDGYREYQQDLLGYKIVGTEPIVKESKPGSDIYLTVDVNIQMFLEQAIDKINKTGNKFVTFTVADAKTGEILGTASNPSFDPNLRNIKNYNDPFVVSYEPGSTMKTYTWMASIENGQYKGNDKYKSGQLKVADSRVTDWYVPGWGNIKYDEGYYVSSNVAATLLGQKLGRQKLMDFFYKAGFGEKTGIELPNEYSGSLQFKYEIEVANATFGQGVKTTPVQNIAALTILTNEGTLLKPSLVSKIVKEDKIVSEFQRTEVRKVASVDTVNKMKKLMYDAVNSGSKYSVVYYYKIKNYGVSGKTGTAQYVTSKGVYSQGNYNNIRSFAGFFPYEDPKIILYISAKDYQGPSDKLASVVKSTIKDISTYLNIYTGKATTADTRYTITSYINKNTNLIEEELKTKKIPFLTIGSEGNKIINQYPLPNTTVNITDKIFLLTNDKNIVMPNMIGWSRSDVLSFANLINLSVSFDGYGYVTKQSIKEGTIVDLNEELEITLAPKYVIDTKEENKEKKKT